MDTNKLIHERATEGVSTDLEQFFSLRKKNPLLNWTHVILIKISVSPEYLLIIDLSLRINIY